MEQRLVIKMSWENTIKKEWDIRDINRSPLMQRREDKRGHYDSPPKRDIRDKCVVKYCAAESCKYNSEKNCTLKHVDITRDGRCRQFKPQAQMRMEYEHGKKEDKIDRRKRDIRDKHIRDKHLRDKPEDIRDKYKREDIRDKHKKDIRD
jgi:hypothetical protein